LLKKVIFCDVEKCTGCQICELVCSSVREKKINPLLSRIHLVRVDPFVMMAFPCQYCDKPTCIRSCLRQALSINGEKGYIMVDEDKCTGCGWCIQPQSCPFGAITIQSKKAVVCNLSGPCSEDTPPCVKHCPKEALLFASRDEISQRVRKDALKKLYIRSRTPRALI
jgi:Fe-S-cluster-containing hydrogenase component 2